ncbi:MAG: alpha-galactosidase [Armatimonadetes bacterium]|nr:alpha-galactosidase [Armatimonadota bacterium]
MGIDTILASVVLVGGSLASGLASNAYTNIAVRDSHDGREVRFTSQKTIYVEGMLKDRWVGRYWTTDGRINWPYEYWSEDAFQLEIDKEQVSGGWDFVSASELPQTERGARHFVVRLSHAARRLNVEIHTLLDATPLITRWLEITNTSDKPVALTGVYPWCSRLWSHAGYAGYPPKGYDGPFKLGYFTKQDWGWEGWFDWKTLENGTTTIKCDKGQGFDDPFFIVHNEPCGQYLIGHLAWSANWRMEFMRGRDGEIEYLAFKIGPTAGDALRVIAPGEKIRTPEVHLGYVAGDLDATVQALHDHLRRSVLPIRNSKQSCLIQYSVPGDQGYLRPSGGGFSAFTEKTVLDCIDVAAAIGCEVFILDAGWWEQQGDWYPSATRFPHGLEPLVEYAHKKGLLFGLYGEIERVYGSGSRVAKEHPDWIGTNGVLNLTRPEVAAWVESELTRLIEKYKLDLYRLDYNPIFTFEGLSTPRDGFMENNYWRYYEFFYGLFERIRKKYPDLILQQCAAGGGRNDLGTAGRFQEDYLTDGLRMPYVLQNYSGQTLALPPEVFVIALGADGGPSTGRPANFDTHLRVTFSLSTPFLFAGMVAPSLADLGPERREQHLRYVNIYKNFIRPLLPTCRMYHHAPASSKGGVSSEGWFAVEFASPDMKSGWATIVRIGASDYDIYLLKPRGLHRGKKYVVTLDSTGERITLDGLQLMRDGLPIRLEAVMSSDLVLFEAK